MRFSSRRHDADADVIRARLRALLEDRPVPGWVPDPEDERLWPYDGTDAADREAGVDPHPEVAAIDSPGLPPGIGRHRAPGRATRWNPGRSGARSLWIAGLVAVLALTGWTWLQRPQVEPAPAGNSRSVGTTAPTAPVGEAAETSAAVVVSVVGLVVRPGLVTLPAGARVADAVDAAGGLLPEADPASVNLAAPVSDGAQIAVGLSAAVAGQDGSGVATPGAGSRTGGRVDLNAATVADLDALPGIGPVLAQRIVEHRTRHGPFRTVDELDDVPGIGPATAAELAELVSV